MSIRKISIRTKLLVLLIVPIVVISLSAILIAGLQIRNQGYQALEEKSSAVLSRMEAVRTFIAQQGGMERNVLELTQEYPDGDIPMQEREQLKKRVPIIASWMIGEKNARADNYKFRIAATEPRTPAHKASKLEEKFLKQFYNGNQASMEYINDATNELWVMRPVKLDESQGCLICHGKPETSPWGNGKDILGYPLEDWSDGDLHGMFVIKSDLAPVQARMWGAVGSISGWAVVIALLAILLGFVLIKLIVGTVEQIHGVSQKVAEGNLTGRIKVRSEDELGDLSSYINQMTGSLQGIIREIRELSSYLSNATQEISSTSNTISDGSQSQAHQLERLSQSGKQVAQAAQQANLSSQDINKNAREAGESVDSTKELMHDIKARSEKIQAAIGVIAEIARQTNLLSLNASVEAARAGQHGKGFAVVAGEVKKLADDSAKSSSEITKIIEEAVDLIGQGAAQSEQASKRLANIIEQIAGSAEQLDQIELTIRQQAEAMGQANEVTTTNASSAEQLEASAHAIAEQAKNLEVLLTRFRLE